jgi:hypothetical protein
MNDMKRMSQVMNKKTIERSQDDYEFLALYFSKFKFFKEFKKSNFQSYLNMLKHVKCMGVEKERILIE